MAENHKNNKMVVTAGRSQHQPDENSYAPLVDIFETTEGTIVLVAEMPGAARDSIDIRVDKGVLSIFAELPLPEPEGEYARTYVGFSGGQFFRAFALSDEVDRDGIEASYEDGVLTVRLPRAAAAKTRKIAIKGA